MDHTHDDFWTVTDGCPACVDIYGEQPKSADYMAGAAAERKRIRRELLDELSRLDVEADQLVHIGEERWYSQPEMLAAIDRICPE